MDFVSLDLKIILDQFQAVFLMVIDWFTSPKFYAQCGLILLAVILGYSLGRWLLKYSSLLNKPPADNSTLNIKTLPYKSRNLITPLLIVMALAMAVEISILSIQQSALVRTAQALAVLVMFYALISNLVNTSILKTFFKWIVMPIAILHVFGWLDPAVKYLDDVDISVGNIEFSIYGILRTLFFGLILFWLGRFSNNFGQQLIRKQEDLDIGTREIFAKLFEVFLLIVILFVLLQIMGVNLTTLAVLGGAVGVGLGFGLQSIASNFISGIILLLDRSLVVGDYIELEDGKMGTIRALNMRSTTLETYDGKDIVVPNEKFITSSFVNWTHKDSKQRYSLAFQVAYQTDLHTLFPLLREAISKHPQVISGDDVPHEERPDAEISGFGDSGVDILIEFWMEGIDDGPNRVGADLLLIIWDVLKEHVVEIPYPQREVRIVNNP
jgi:small-conductance mechanosensitive channel